MRRLNPVRAVRRDVRTTRGIDRDTVRYSWLYECKLCNARARDSSIKRHLIDIHGIRPSGIDEDMEEVRQDWLKRNT